jgi:2-phospho-L-lactate/phosphoenolpyruvate guanylyltransferase
LKIFAIVPVKGFERGKSRLSSMLEVEERVELCELLLDDTLSTLNKASSICEVVVVSSDKRAQGISKRYNARFLREYTELGVNKAITIADDYCNAAHAHATLVIPQDLPLLIADDIDRICSIAEENEKCLAICPSLRYDGSNALLRKPPQLINTYYDSNSFVMHIKAAKEIRANLKIILSRRIMTDLDTIEDAKNLMNEPTMTKSVRYLRSKVKLNGI